MAGLPSKAGRLAGGWILSNTSLNSASPILFYLILYIFFLNSCMYGGRAPKGVELCNKLNRYVCMYVFKATFLPAIHRPRIFEEVPSYHCSKKDEPTI